MKANRILVGGLVAAGLGAAGYGLYEYGMAQGMKLHTTAPAAEVAADAAQVADPSKWGIPEGEKATRRHIRDGLRAGQIDPVTGREILYYHDPMVPAQRFDAPARSPFMDMMLVPVYAGRDGADAGSVTISARTVQNLGLRTAEVVEGVLAPVVSASGAIAWNERDQAVLQARASGFVEKLHVRATLDAVGRGEPLVELYVPDWVAVQEEFLALGRMRGPELEPLLDAARQRMRQAGMSEAQIRLVERSGRVHARITIEAPIDGVVTELSVREGMTVMAGATLARINGLGSVWAEAEVPESQAALLRPGTKVTAVTPARPGVTFEGRVQALLPQVDVATRTQRARLELDNPDGLLVAGMFVRMMLSDPMRTALLVPADALIHTGRRSVVMLAEGEGRFRPVEVEPGLEAAGRVEVRSGLRAGQRVVLSGQFLIDSEASLRGLEARIGQEDEAAAGPPYRTEALLEAIDGDLLTLTHPEIPVLRWPEMTMDFRLAPGLPTSGLAEGQQVVIEFLTQDSDVPHIVSIEPVQAGGER
jgi:membrane fusion protein, copper/silver efflux system